MIIRPFSSQDSYASLTELLHRAYAPLAAEGLQFWASHQSVDETRKRAEEGYCFVAEENGAVLGTIAVHAGHAKSHCTFYRRSGVWIFGQFAVEPALQRKGIGAALLMHAEQFVRNLGAKEFSCDTAETASRLIAYYGAHGFHSVDHVQWDVSAVPTFEGVTAVSC